MSNPNIQVNQIDDIYIRRNFQALIDYFTIQNQLLNFKFAEIIFNEATSDFKYAHQLGVIPQDLIVTQRTGTGIVTFNNGLFDETYLDISASAACRIRFFYGLYEGFTSSANTKLTDTSTY